MLPRPVALVTGSAQRVGRAIVHDLAAHGFDVAVHYRRSREAAEATVAGAQACGARAQAFAADLSDEAAARALLPAVAAHFGRVDAVVNNASEFEYDAPASFSYAQLERQLRANTAPAIVLAQALHDHLASVSILSAAGRAPAEEAHASTGRRGCVVNLLDQKLWNPNPDYFSYTLSKAALESATTLLAMALAPRVRVCGVAPGVTLVSGPMSEGEFERAHRLTPLQRSSTPEDIARTVRFLIESPAITGTTLLVDGGQHLAGQPRDVLFLAREAAVSPSPAP
jgi:NAD(P)-dependent dehydrogenase (short-subunit alcohol dehydrogenase family)